MSAVIMQRLPIALLENLADALLNFTDIVPLLLGFYGSLIKGTTGRDR
jgi:hypothetical protein